jgi:hypothetical protein
MRPIREWDPARGEYVDSRRKENPNRGYWCTNLYGGAYYHPGLLNFFCNQDPKTKRYVRNNVDHENEPWGVMREHCPKPGHPYSTRAFG